MLDNSGQQWLSPARAVITPALEQRLKAEEERLRTSGKRGHYVEATRFRIIFDLNPDYPQGRRGATGALDNLLVEARGTFADVSSPASASLRGGVRELGRSYLVETLRPDVIRWVVHKDVERTERDRGNFGKRAIRRVWPDFQVYPMLDRSVATVKGDAAQSTFGAYGDGINWAVVDSGVDAAHPHFRMWKNLEEPDQLEHVDLTGGNAPTVDRLGQGHGTAVAGVIAGEIRPDAGDARRLKVRRGILDSDNEVEGQFESVSRMCGVAPRCKVISYRVFDGSSPAYVSNVIAALEHIQQVNDYGRNIRIHGVNLSLGYTFHPEWFVGGYSPLCSEVDRMVQSGVVVVVAAGNSGFTALDGADQDFSSGVTINDPGNAASAITVGSTHRDAPHRFGISYFSSKGPTGDGRYKPDLVAPGEYIVTCASSQATPDVDDWEDPDYAEFSGTSIAAAHVSGAIAAFLSVRREFIGQPERVKQIFLSAATDLGRVREFQGHGMVDVMRAIQAV
jgi:subtilisin family serine protease